MPRGSHVVGGLRLRPVHVPELFSGTRGLGFEVHAFGLGPAVYYVTAPGPLILSATVSPRSFALAFTANGSHASLNSSCVYPLA